MDSSSIVSIIALSISVVVFISNQFWNKKTTGLSETDSMRSHIEKLEARVSKLEEENLKLFEENVRLMKIVTSSI